MQFKVVKALHVFHPKIVLAKKLFSGYSRLLLEMPVPNMVNIAIKPMAR
uniref:Uncharacterized protein n=1 Tax=Rhizophora mucronata TaxID=61149 RepID=A0A2P2MM91_RHIMU